MIRLSKRDIDILLSDDSEPNDELLRAIDEELNKTEEE